MLAEVTLAYDIVDDMGATRSASMPIQVNLVWDGAGYRWAGPAFDALYGEHVIVYYPTSEIATAEMLLPEAETFYHTLETDLGLPLPDTFTIKLFNDARTFRAGVSPTLLSWVERWTEAGESIKLLLPSDFDLAESRRALTHEMTRRVLFDAGIRTPWLVEGLAEYESGQIERTDNLWIITENLPRAGRAIQRDRGLALEEIAFAHTLPEDDAPLAIAEAWDAVHYLWKLEEPARIQDLLGSLQTGVELDLALREYYALTLDEFEEQWRESAAMGHITDSQVAVAHQFDETEAEVHIDVLAGPAFEGRQAGSPENQIASEYIAGQFAACGLTPAGDNGGYFQTFPISYTTWLAPPRLNVETPEGEAVRGFVFREEFVAAISPAPSAGVVEADLIWVQDANYQDMQLAGKIAIRNQTNSLDAEIASAIEHGAGGLILISDITARELQAKQPFPVTASGEATIPVVRLSKDALPDLLTVGDYSLKDINTAPSALPLALQARIEIPLQAPSAARGANVLALLPGVDPELSQEVIIIGAHYDHVGDDPAGETEGLKYPGDNDDASGIGVMLEMARQWQAADYQPARTILFAAWDAQEAGEVGSGYYMAHPAFPLEETRVMIQLDAVGAGKGYYLQIEGDRQRDSLPIYAMEMAAEHDERRIGWINPEGRSDHYSFWEADVPAILLTWRESSEENLPGGLTEEIDLHKLRVTGRTVALGVMLLAQLGS